MFSSFSMKTWCQVRSIREYKIDTVDVKFLNGDGGSCTVGREPLDAQIEPTLRGLYEDYIAGRMGCMAWDSDRAAKEGATTQGINPHTAMTEQGRL